MKTSRQWIDHFKKSAQQQRIDWRLKPSITDEQIVPILSSVQAWQLGETSEGVNLLHASTLYANKIGDIDYIDAVKLFIKEEQKHGENLGKYLDAIGKPRIKKDLGDTMFRKVRHFNTSMEIWTVTVITVESAAQIFYQCLKNCSECTLLKQICTDILIDESFHIDFQTERLQLIFYRKSFVTKFISRCIYPTFFFATSLVVWFAHRKLFKAGGTDFKKFMLKMTYKYFKTLHRVAFAETLHKRRLQTDVEYKTIQG